MVPSICAYHTIHSTQSTHHVGSQGHTKIVHAEYELPVRGNGHQHNAHCTVCETTRSKVLMLPAHTSCYGGWTKEYEGYLMTEHKSAANTKHSTKFVCVDKYYDVIAGSGADQWPATHLYHVEADCSGIIPCSQNQYNDYKEITCVVCSK